MSDPDREPGHLNPAGPAGVHAPAGWAEARSDVDTAAHVFPWRSWFQQLAAVMLKETKQVTRDPSSWIIAVVMPLTFLFLFGYGISLDTTVVKIALVREDGSQDARDFAASLEGSRWFLVVHAPDRASGKRLLQDQTVKAVVIIPGELGETLHASSRTAQVQVLVDGAEPNTANYVRGYVTAIWSGFLANRGLLQGASLAAPINVEPRYWFNPNAESRWFLIPGSMTVIMTLLGTLLTALVIAREWERGTLEALYATPLTKGQILIGKTLPYFVLAMISMAVCIVTALVLFRLPLRGSLLTLGLVSAVFLVPSLGQGILISVTMRTQLAAAQLGLMTGYLPAMMLSGFLFDIHSMPGWLQAVTLLIPARYMNVSLQTVFLAGDLWPVLLPNMLFMLAVGALFFGMTWFKLRKRVD